MSWMPPRLREPSRIARVLVLGAGHVGSAVARLARSRGLAVTTTVRSNARAENLGAEGFEVVARSTLDLGVAALVDGATHVVVAFPPDGVTDARIAPALRDAAATTYVSTTGVYGDTRGRIDDDTPLPTKPTERGRRVLDAEAAYRDVGATVLRSPAIYGPTRGLHARVLRGEHRIPGDGSRFLSRVHVEDLAAFALASAAFTGETFVVGDLAPAPHLEVVEYVCAAYGVPLPEHVPLESVHESLRADRRIDPSRALQMLGVAPRFPSYRDGMSPSATGLRSRE
jgi:nucleoside-diphosphate-sugar epimerase